MEYLIPSYSLFAAYLRVFCSDISRDAIAKALYSRLFTWLVERINSIVCRSERDKTTSLAILDIFGFEVTLQC